ncbi:chaplin family protein [Streptomyces sp. NBC_01387]|uniref:chaplin family protein n=1 Tax=unclassified Streptomyces TaxID=2593676 RepID=UPI0020254CA5|nr:MULTISPECIES: chaplin family protein [unclassified Streptomyces]WSC24263.1 chaplin family protein [Streptomyces sp. NBC_01766]WSV58149.1 chaplin family protein [Streptomyces sp. NBC_01014]
MKVDMLGTGSKAAKAGVRAAVLGAVAGATLLPAGAAHASVIGVGDAVFGNACVNQDHGVRAAGATVTGSGVGGGNHAALPLSLPRNHCGSSGIVCTAVFGSSV